MCRAFNDNYIHKSKRTENEMKYHEKCCAALIENNYSQELTSKLNNRRKEHIGCRKFARHVLAPV